MGPTASADEAGTIRTEAGSTPGYSGDGGTAVEAQLTYPNDVAIASDGDLIIADTLNYRVRRVDAETGVITTIAGHGGYGFSGDGGPASDAVIHVTYGIAVDHQGNIFLADSYNYRVRRIDAGTGVITTVAGNGIKHEDPNGDGGPATQASVKPFDLDLAADGTMFIADPEQHRIRKVDPETGVITTFAGTGDEGSSGDGGPAVAATFSLPSAVVVDDDGSLYIADTGNNLIRRVDPLGVVTTVAGRRVIPSAVGTIAGASQAGTPGILLGDGGPATKAILSSPSGLAIDPEGRLLVSDTGNNRVRRLDLDGTVETVAGNGAMEIPGGWVSGEFWSAYSGDGGPATKANLGEPHGLAVDGSGDLFVAQVRGHRVRRVQAPLLEDLLLP